MRIALICETFLPSVNGVTTTLCRALEYLNRRGHQALLFAPLGAPSSYAGTEIVPLGSLPLPFYPEVQLTPPQFGLTAHLRHFRPDLVHLVGPAVFGAIAPTVARSLALPVVSSYHTNFDSYSAHYGFGLFKHSIIGYLRWVHNRCFTTLCPSTATRDDLRRQGFRRLRVWGRGVDTQRFHPDHRSDDWRAAAGARPGETLLLYVGRLAREKRVDLLAHAIDGIPNARLVVVGDGPARAELARTLHGLPVHFTGYLSGSELSCAYASADLFVFPSDTDTFGQVIQEAMASGLPVVAARAGGAADLVRDGVTGLCFTPGSGVDLRAQVRSLLADASARRAMGMAGRAVAERHSWPSVLGELEGYYEHAVSLARRRRRNRVAPT